MKGVDEKRRLSYSHPQLLIHQSQQDAVKYKPHGIQPEYLI